MRDGESDMAISELDEQRMLDTCALRFDGWKYQEERNQGGERWEWPNPTATRIFSENEMDNLAAFFALQRYLGKWGGEYNTVYSDEHVVFRLLFLHLYKTEIPEGYRTREWYPKWQEKYEPIREECAALIRKTFRRKGRGPKIAIDATDPNVKAIREANSKLRREE